MMARSLSTVCVIYVVPASQPLPSAAGVITSDVVSTGRIGRWSPELVVAVAQTPRVFWESCRYDDDEMIYVSLIITLVILSNNGLYPLLFPNQ